MPPTIDELEQQTFDKPAAQPIVQQAMSRPVSPAPKSKGSPAVKFATQRGSDMDAEANSVFGDELKALDDQERAERHQRLQKEVDKIHAEGSWAGAQTNALEMTAGAALGFKALFRNVYNGMVDVADAAENFAARHGIGTGDIITEANKWKKSEFDTAAEQELGALGTVSKGVAQYAMPVLGVIASGGGLGPATATGAISSFLAQDPHDPHLSDALVGTGLDELPIANEVIDFLKTKPSDTEMQSRLKNMAEGIGIDAAAAGLVWTASSAYKAAKGFLKGSGRAAEAVAQEAKPAASAAEQVLNPAPVSDAEQAALNANDAAISTKENVSPTLENKPAGEVVPKTGTDVPKLGTEAQPHPEQLSLDLAAAERAAQQDKMEQLSFEFQAKRLQLDEPAVAVSPEIVAEKPREAVRVNLSDDKIVDYFTNVMQATKNVELYRGPVSDKEALEVANRLKNDPAVLDRLASWTPKDGPLSIEDHLVVKYVLGRADDAIRDSATQLIAGNDELSTIKFMRDLENYVRIQQIKEGVASEQGRSLRSNQILAALAGTGEKEALKQLGAQGRAKLAQELVKKSGGIQRAQSLARSIDFISEMSRISNIPNQDFAYHMGEVVKKTPYMRFDDALTTVAMNGMLSSPMTPLKALFTNFATTTKSVVDNYVAYGIGSTMNSADVKSLAEANAHLRGAFSGFLEAIGPAFQTLKTGIPEDARLFRIDLAPGVNTLMKSSDDVAEMAGGAWVSTKGYINDAVTLPTRVLMSVDTFWQHVNYRGVVNAAAVREAEKQGLEGAAKADFIDNFLHNVPSDVDEQASKLAATNTMAKQLEGRFASIAQGADAATSWLPGGRVILPFMKTNLNLVEYNILNSPLAFLNPNVINQIKSGGRVRDEALAKVVSTSTAVGALMWMVHEGLVTGPDTDNPEVSQALRDNKNTPPPSSIKVGDTWVSLRGNEPVESVVNAASVLAKVSGYVTEGEYDKLAASLMALGVELTAPESIIQGVADLANTITGKQDVKQYGANVAGRFMPFGGLVNDVRQTMDPATRDTRAAKEDPNDPTGGFKEFYQTVKNRYSNMVPGLSKDLPANRNIWGEKVVLPDGIGPDAFSPFATGSEEGLPLKKTLEAMDAYADRMKGTNANMLKLDIKLPSRTIKNPFADLFYDLTPQEHKAYVLLGAGIDPVTGKHYMGKTLKEAVTDILNKHGMMGKDPAQIDGRAYTETVSEVAKTMMIYQDAAKKRIIYFGDVGHKMQEQQRNFMSLEELKRGAQ